MNQIKDKIKALASQYLQEVIAIRRHIHQHPELSNEEYNTAKYITEKLDEFKVPYTPNIAKTGIVALIKGKNPDKKVVALRADMDALPVTELTNASYASLIPGVSHCCGHDAHVASLLGTVKILKELSNEFEGTIKFIFQPSEEEYVGGADIMIAEGVLKDPEPDGILGQHTFPELEVGKVGFKSGEYMASTDEIFLTINGKGGHAATPHLTVDPVLIGSHIIVTLQQIVSRMAFPVTPTVLSFGRFIANGKTNVIPDTVAIEGTFRTFDETWRKEAHKRITNIATSLAQSMGGSCDVRIEHGYPVLTNNKDLTERSRAFAKEFLGEENVVELSQRMTAEDFAYYCHVIPGCFYRLGTRNTAKGITANLHTAKFDIDEGSLEIGMGLMSWLAICELTKK